jgi:P27 family predicted phage terminase small subunit
MAYRDGLLDELEKVGWLGPLNSPMVADFVNTSLALFQADRWLSVHGRWKENEKGETVINPVVETRTRLSTRLEKLSERLGFTPAARMELEEKIASQRENLLDKYLDTEAREADTEGDNTEGDNTEGDNINTETGGETIVTSTD